MLLLLLEQFFAIYRVISDSLHRAAAIGGFHLVQRFQNSNSFFEHLISGELLRADKAWVGRVRYRRKLFYLSSFAM